MDGFVLLRTSTVNLTSRYQAQYFGHDSMKLGLEHLLARPRRYQLSVFSTFFLTSTWLGL